MSAFRFSLVALSLVACISGKNSDDSGNLVTEGDSDDTQQQDTNPPTQSGFEPDYVIFGGMVNVQNSTDIECFADEDGENCGVLIVGLIKNSDWQGWSDGENGCLIYFDPKPSFVVSGDIADGYINAGSFYGWEFNAAEAYLGATNACGEIDASDPAAGLFTTLTGTNPTLGFGAASEDMLSAFSQNIPAEDDWDTDWVPYLVNSSFWLGGFSSFVNEDGTIAPVTPGMAIGYELDANGLMTETQIDQTGATYIQDGVYSTMAAYIYQISAFIE